MTKDYDCEKCSENHRSLLTYHDNPMYCISCGAGHCMSCMVMNRVEHCPDFTTEPFQYSDDE